MRRNIAKTICLTLAAVLSALIVAFLGEITGYFTINIFDFPQLPYANLLLVYILFSILFLNISRISEFIVNKLLNFQEGFKERNEILWFKPVFLIIGFLFIISFVYWLVNWGESQASKKDFMVSGSILVEFKDEPTMREIEDYVDSLGLTYQLGSPVEPKAIIPIRSSEHYEVAEMTLNSNNRVRSFKNYSYRGNYDIKEVEVIFQSEVPITEAQEILSQSGSEIKSFARRVLLRVKVPEGKEKYYVEIFKKQSIVKSADLEYQMPIRPGHID